MLLQVRWHFQLRKLDIKLLIDVQRCQQNGEPCTVRTRRYICRVRWLLSGGPGGQARAQPWAIRSWNGLIVCCGHGGGSGARRRARAKKSAAGEHHCARDTDGTRRERGAQGRCVR